MAPLIKLLSGPGLVALAMAATGALTVPQAHAANIIGFADNATACGGSTLCSTSTGSLATGTQGYVETGSTPLDLSTITQWFQIDASGTSHLVGQPAEPLGGAGNFLVVNDTGKVVTKFSLTISDSFTASTPSVTFCSGGSGPLCDQFQIHGGAANYFTNLSLTGPDCFSGCGTNSAEFTSGAVTYNWSGGTGVPIGAEFNLNFASWNTGAGPTSVPLPAAAWLLLSGLGGLLGLMRAQRAYQTVSLGGDRRREGRGASATMRRE
jgi:hypothetical protein